ncbi:unnamed protein product [Sphenostylis stenocarpa]|uniref:RING-type E3 ubiquitin transferase n=1 Tax=Sphenostylis stenocarpa TaxID=92480 RepID=A0AA86VGC3_9FABA|nr:unnamed protein product [Sphenostylis stenocarpa]
MVKNETCVCEGDANRGSKVSESVLENDCIQEKTNLNPTCGFSRLNHQEANMNTIHTFLTAIVLVAQSFQSYMIQRLHKIYKHFGYAVAGKDHEDHESDFCSVCLSQICKGEKVRSLPVCNHRYHVDCIGAWLKNHATCPLCRNKITDHIPPKHKQVKTLGESVFNLIQSFSDLLVAILYMVLPSSITESFPLVH